MKTSEFYKRINKETAISFLDQGIINNQITTRDKELIIECLNTREIQHDKFGLSRWYKYSSILLRLRKTNIVSCPYDELTYSEIISAIGKIKNWTTKKGQPLAAGTQRDYIISILILYRWMVENGIIENNLEILQKLDKIQLPKANEPKIKYDLILNKKEVNSLIASSKSVMYKAMFSVWYELALRPNEVAGLQWRDVKTESRGASITIRTSKTSYLRNIFFSQYYEHLISWRNVTRYNKNTDYIFCNDDGKPLNYDNMNYLYHKQLDLAGIKRVPIYYMRHSRAMHLISEGLSETALKMILEGHIDSDSLKFYVTPSEVMLKNELLKHHGMLNETEVEKPLMTFTCPACRFINTPDSLFCRNCGTPLTMEAKERVDNLIGYINSKQTPIESINNMSDEELLRELQRRYPKLGKA